MAEKRGSVLGSRVAILQLPNPMAILPASGDLTMIPAIRDCQSESNGAVAWRPDKLWSLWDMLQSYFPIYKIAIELQRLRRTADVYKGARREVDNIDANSFQLLLKTIQRECLALGLTAPNEMAKRLITKAPPETYDILFADLDHLDGSLMTELEKEAVFRISPERKDFFMRKNLFGPKVAAAFPSCQRDIRKAGSCYALGQEDACVHHLMLVLERGLNALAAKVGVPYQRTNWQNIIDHIASKLKSAPRGAERDFCLEVNAQFGFLKDAYRNHSEHARDDHYDMPKALSILNHVRGFMQALEKGGLTE
jgi:hypothetical protein